MYKYNCLLCDFHIDFHSNFSRHNESNKQFVIQKVLKLSASNTNNNNLP